MWQFMKATGKGYGLRVDSWVDERRDPFRATDAAARHLRDLNRRFKSLYLAAAAYNAGSGKVSRGLGRLPDDESELTNSDATFFRLYDTKLLRRETKDYVPKLIAAALIAKQPERYGFRLRTARAGRLRLDHRARHDRARRARPPGRYHGGRDPRAEPAVSPARHASGDPVDGAAAGGTRPHDDRGLRRAPGRGSG